MSFPLYLKWFAAQPLCVRQSYCSLHGFAAQSPSIRWLMHWEPTKTAVQLHDRVCAAIWKTFEQVENFLLVGDSTVNALRLTASALRLRWDWCKKFRLQQSREACLIYRQLPLQAFLSASNFLLVPLGRNERRCFSLPLLFCFNWAVFYAYFFFLSYVWFSEFWINLNVLSLHHIQHSCLIKVWWWSQSNFLL